MEKIRIITDSVSDIPADRIGEYELEIIPAPVYVDSVPVMENIDCPSEELFTLLRENKKLRVGHIPAAIYLDRFRLAFAHHYHRVIVITPAEQFSGMYRAACEAREMFWEQEPDAQGVMQIDVLDSGSYSLGYGLPVLKACERIQQGATGAEILGTRGIEEAYRTGRGKIRVRSVTNIEPMANGKNRIIVTELPFMVNKARLIEKIAELVRDKKIDGITDLSDQSSREGMRICIELRRDVNPNVILNQLYKHTQLQDTFGVIMLALVNGEPKVMNLLDMLKYYLQHQEEVVTRRTKYDLNKAEERAHILQGLLIALDNIDEVIRIIRGSKTVQIAKTELMERFELSDAQAQAIVDMRLRALTGLEREKIE